MESDTRTNAASSGWFYKRRGAYFWKSTLARRSFDELLDAVDQAIGSIRCIGDLLLYDTALRIGANLGIMPDRVYLHSGTRRGARALGLAWKRRSISIAELPVALRGLKPHEIEDCLCIFKDRFRDARP